MTALAANRDTAQIDTTAIPETGSLPLAAAAKIFAGSLVASDASGNAVPASANPNLVIMGVAPALVDNTGGAAAALTTVFKRGAFPFGMGAGADAITIANRMQPCYASDDNTVNLTDGGGARPFAGTILDVVGTQVTVLVGLSVGPSTAPTPSSNVATHRARTVGTANHSLVAFVGVTGGSSTNTDGVLCVAGDIVLLVSQTAAAANGPYVVGTVAAGTAPLTRPAWWAAGSTMPSGAEIQISGEGTLYKNTFWRACVAAKSFVVDTTDPQCFPESVLFTAALVAGAMTAGVGATAGAPANLPVFSASSSLFMIRKTANTTAATIMYAQNGAATPGAPGTGAVSAFATVAAGTLNNADISTLEFLLVNQI